MFPPRFPPQGPYVPFNNPPNQLVDSFASFLIPNRDSLPPWPSHQATVALEYPATEECLASFESFGLELLFHKDIGTLGDPKKGLLDLNPRFRMLAQAPYLNFLGIRLEHQPYGAPIRGILETDVPELSQEFPLNSAWKKFRAGRILYKRLLRLLFFLKDRFGTSPLFVGTYLSSEGLGKFPSHGKWVEEHFTFFKDLEITEPTTVTFPPQIVLAHLGSSPSPIDPKIRCYQENLTPSYGDAGTSSPYTFESIQDSILMPVPPSTGPYPSSASLWKRTAWTDAGFESARWDWASKTLNTSSGKRVYTAKHTRATINLVDPHVRRWWTEKVLQYVEDWQGLAKEAIEEYLDTGLPGRENPSDFFYRANLPSGTSKHPRDWRLGSLFLDNIDGPSYLDGSFVPLQARNYAPKPDAATYVRYNESYKQYKNRWCFLAAMVKELREQVKKRWGMNVLYNTFSIVNNLEEDDFRGKDLFMMNWPFPDGGTPLRLKESLAYLSHPLFQYPLQTSEELALEERFDAFVFEQPWKENTFDGDYTFVSVARTTVDGQETPFNPDPNRAPDDRYIVDNPLHKFARCCRWIRGLMQKKKMVIFYPINPPPLHDGATEVEKRDHNLIFPVRFYDYRFLTCLSWILRVPRSSLYVNLSFFDFDQVEKLPPFPTANFDGFESFFFLPSLLRKREGSAQTPALDSFSVVRRFEVTNSSSPLEEEEKEKENPILLRQEHIVAFPAQGIRIPPAFSFSLPEAVTLHRLASARTEDHVVWLDVDLYLARLSGNVYAFRTPKQKNLKTLKGYPEPFTSPLVWMQAYRASLPHLRNYFDAKAERWRPLRDYNRLEEPLYPRRVR